MWSVIGVLVDFDGNGYGSGRERGMGGCGMFDVLPVTSTCVGRAEDVLLKGLEVVEDAAVDSLVSKF